MENACVKEDDVWALGVLIYEFLTGNMLSREDHDNRILEMVNMF
jgi:serine/threonine protein kinase